LRSPCHSISRRAQLIEGFPLAVTPHTIFHFLSFSFQTRVLYLPRTFFLTAFIPSASLGDDREKLSVRELGSREECLRFLFEVIWGLYFSMIPLHDLLPPFFSLPERGVTEAARRRFFLARCLTLPPRLSGHFSSIHSLCPFPSDRSRRWLKS